MNDGKSLRGGLARKAIEIAATALALSVISTSNGQTCFDTASSNAGSAPVVVQAGDLNHDGLPDLVVGNLGSTSSLTAGSITVFLATGPATFDSGVTYDTVGFRTWGVAIGDLDGDGSLDVATVEYASDQLSVFTKNGRGELTRIGGYGTGAGTNPVSVAIVDYDRDGHEDILTANYARFSTADSVNLFRNQGMGAFDEPVPMRLPGEAQPQGLAVADLNNDGWPDFVTAENGGDGVSVFLNDTQGSFLAAVSYASGNDAYYVVADDFDGDGDADLAVTNHNEGMNGASVSVFLNDGVGRFVRTSVIPVASGPLGIVSADFDGDCDKDVMVAHYGGLGITVLHNGGNASSWSPQFIYTGTTHYGLATADFDRSGAPDAVSANFAPDGKVMVFLNGCWRIVEQPQSTLTCSIGEISFSVSGNGSLPFQYQWQVNYSGHADEWIDLSDGPLVDHAELIAVISGSTSSVVDWSLRPAIVRQGEIATSIQTRCVVSNTCGETESDPAMLTVCSVDFNCDGFLDFFDYDDFVDAFEGGDASADFNRDGFLDFFDYDDFVLGFETGC